MTINNRYQFSILCEDKQMNSFIRNILKEFNVNTKKKVYTYPFGPDGSGEQRVRVNLPDCINKIRTGHVSRVLIVCTDADKCSVENRKKTLEKECAENGIEWIQKDEPIIVWIPRRNIESWIKYYRTGEFDETQDYGHLNQESKCKAEAKKMADDLQNNRLESSIYSSLKEAQAEFNRLRTIID